MGGIGRLVRILALVAVALALVLTVALPPPSAAATTAGSAPDTAATEPAETVSLGIQACVESTPLCWAQVDIDPWIATVQRVSIQ